MACAEIEIITMKWLEESQGGRSAAVSSNGYGLEWEWPFE